MSFSVRGGNECGRSGLADGTCSVGAYQKHTAGQLTWKLVGMWAGAIGLFAAGDYYLSL